jgi:hypothetical protein
MQIYTMLIFSVLKVDTVRFELHIKKLMVFQVGVSNNNKSWGVFLATRNWYCI